ncbi:MAG: tRNA lysidine(34) synthetase TilS [Firmicutes bacterium]|nr:tRNA lysidine(34) synthetase TilS [Bacillota bacterium]
MNELDNFLKDDIFLNENKVLVAFSGGPDSVFMLEILSFLKDKYNLNFDIELYHLNHCLRENAINDEKFVIDYSDKNKYKLHLSRINVADLKDYGLNNIEEAGRIVRYNELNKIADEINTSTIITAHHLNDDIETFIMNLKRGTGLKGASGIKVREGRYFRPLLGIKKSDILNYLDENNLAYCIDETNYEIDNTRNYIRNIIVPKLEKLDDNFYDNMHKMLFNLKNADTNLNSLIDYFIEKEGDVRDNQVSLPVKKIKYYFKNNRAELYFAIINKLTGSTKDIYSGHVDLIDSIINSDGESSIKIKDMLITKSYGDLIFTFGDEVIFDKKDFCLYDNPPGIAIDMSKVAGEIEFTTRELGDRFESRGGLNKKLKDILIDEKIPKYMRDKLLVLRDDLGIIYVEGLWLVKRVEPSKDSIDIKYLREVK